MSVERFWHLLEEKTGLQWTEGLPLSTIQAHLHQRAAALGHPSIDAYTARLEREPDGSAEWQSIVDVATNGQTWFFRGEPQLDEFAKLMGKLRGTGRTARIWSVACSTGEEPYTLAMIAAEADVSATILGTDLNAGSVMRADQGLYDAFALRAGLA